MKLRYLFVFSLIILATNLSTAQDTEEWSLEDCINHAMKHSLQVQQSELAIQQGMLNKKQAFWSQFPNLNASLSHGLNLGRSIDMTSYEFVNQTTQSTNVSLSLGIPIYQGLRIRNTIKQTKIDLSASQKDLEQSKNTVALSVAQAYLSILLAEENLEVLKEQTKVTQAQLEQTQKLIKAGVVADNSRFDLEAQLAREEESIVNAENGVELAYVNLKMLMNVDVGQNIVAKRIEVQVPENIENNELETVYDEARSSQPNIVAARLREQSALIGVKIAKGSLQPTVSGYVNVNTNFSSAAKDITGYDTTYQSIPLNLGSVTGSLDFPSIRPERGRVTPFFSQLGNNLYTNLGIRVQVPIFNGFQARIGVQRAKLAMKTAELNTQTLETQLKSDVYRALTDVKAAAKRLKAAEKTIVATRASVKNTQKRYTLGVVNSFELTSVQNSLLASESNVLQAKYDYLFKLKILDYYRGRPIKID
ncbi:MAG: TolC family protein [Aureispira sp.]|nr:TolC family protein [Aureispira sp.]